MMPIDTTGLLGGSSTTSARRIASSTPGAAVARSSPATTNRRAGTVAWCRTHHSWKWIARSPPSSSSTTTWVSTGTSVIGSSSMRCSGRPHRAASRAVTSLSEAPCPSHCERTTWVPTSRSPRREPLRDGTVRRELALHPVALVGAAPALALVDAVAERVEQGVEVGADPQAEQGDVVAGVRDDGDRRVREAGSGVEVVAQTADEAGSADAAGEGRDVHVRESVSPVRGGGESARNAGAAGKMCVNNTKRLDVECMTRV